MFSLEVTPQFIPDRIAIPVELSSCSVSVPAPVLSTAIILIRILVVSRIARASHQPQIAMETIIKSDRIYCISALVYISISSYLLTLATAITFYVYAELFLPTWPLRPIPFVSLPPSSNSISQDFAPALIMLRVVLRSARPDTQWSEKISPLRFSSTPRVQDSARSRGAASTILTVPRSHHGEEGDLEADQDSEPRTELLDLADGMGGTKEEEARI